MSLCTSTCCRSSSNFGYETVGTDSTTCKEPSSLRLLALAYSNSSDSKKDEDEPDIAIKGYGTGEGNCLELNGLACDRIS